MAGWWLILTLFFNYIFLIYYYEKPQSKSQIVKKNFDQEFLKKYITNYESEKQQHFTKKAMICKVQG